MEGCHTLCGNVAKYIVLSEWWVGLQQGLHRHWSIENSLPLDSECSFHQVSHRMLVGLGFFVLKGQHLDMPVMGGFILTIHYQRESWNVWHLKFSNSLALVLYSCGSISFAPSELPLANPA